MQHSTPRPTRQQVLVVLHADNFLEVFGEKHVDVRIVRCPQSFSNDSGIMADDWLEQTLPRRWRQLFFPGKVRATANVRPLLPTKIREAKFVAEMIATLNKLGAT